MKDLRNLPTPVVERLGAMFTDRGPDIYRRNLDVVQRGRLLEARSARVEFRRDASGTAELDGYATVYEYPYEVCGGPPYGWVETMAAGATTKSVLERDDVRMLFDHDYIPIARTRSGTLVLESDDIGLHCSTPNGVDLSSPFVASLVSAVDRRDLDEMSVAFQCIRQEWNEDYTERRILEVRLFDVSLVTYPANPAAVVQARDDEPDQDPGGEGRPAMSLATARALADHSRLRA